MQYFIRAALLVSILSLLSCTATRKGNKPSTDDGKLEVVFVQVNDVYEIAPVSGGKSGGVARVATLKKEIQKGNPNTFLVMAGDFISPSVYNSLTYQGKRIRGKQMIEAMNAAGTDFAIFGNHEFDITESELQDRINESSFRWISSNSFHKSNGRVQAFQKVSGSTALPFPEYLIIPLTDADGTTAKIGLIGITLPFNKAEYVEYTDPLSTAEKVYTRIKDSCDAIIAITHQFIEDDIALAERIPSLAAVLGGHEHDMRLEKVGNVPISKAHANAKSAYVTRLTINIAKKSSEISPTLRMLDETMGQDSLTSEVVKKWTDIANENYSSLGFDAMKVVIASGDSLDGRETETRSVGTNLTELIPLAMADACPEAVAAIVNAGSIRLDDILYPPITQYDILRTLPFGGGIREADLKGSLLLQVLDAGEKNRGTGGFLHYSSIQYRPSSNDPTRGEWIIRDQKIDSGKVYRVAFSDFLLTGKEANLGFLNKDNPGIIRVYDAVTTPSDPRSDIRLAIIKYLEKRS